MSTEQRLAYMADQIARNFAALGHERAITATADHIASFWDPRMKRLAFALLDGERPSWLTTAAASALHLLRSRGAPPPQTPATEFNHAGEIGHSDAG
ncbi:formate dehydrogenase subunit delta [Sphingomonas profundi]|uniref:formate dehydrogenase subunit delta n=1 Tax=Alterirhizorhabdus profundi TaxID=2681549 RepID=UPI001E2D0C7D|nr:formate dehydrogenase subunit delta [Sphingomonas profundi]